MCGTSSIARSGHCAPRRGRLGLWMLGIGFASRAAMAGPDSGPPPAVTDPGCGEFILVQRSGTVIYGLPHGFLRAGSDSVWTAVRPWTRGVDYVLDRTRGTLRLLREPVPGETLRVSACWLLRPPPLELQINAYRPARGLPDSLPADSLRVPEGMPLPRPITARNPSVAPLGTSLTMNGNKTFAVDFGSSQDAFLRQSLDLSLSGSLAPGVELTGVLSDRNLPLSAAGATEDIQSVDRLLMELRAPQGGAALGDVSLRLQRGEFGKLERQVQGVRGEWSAGGFQGIAAAASAQGEYHSLQFFGVEGLQGPYQLTDRSGAIGISVVAGSEVVTLDGERLTRGEGADYAMDYERARLTFTNRRPISANSRIAVDYQFSVNRYRRNLALGGGSWGRGPWYAFTSFMSESDDRGRPLDRTFDASDLLVLESVGDSASLAVSAGVTAGPGDYDLVLLDSTHSYYAFAGPDSGRWAVSFARVGYGEGDYADSALVGGRAAYRYVGPGQGVYRVGRLLPLPESRRLWSLGAGLGRGPLRLELEGALSSHDRNTFSSRDDQDDIGRAGLARLSLEGAAPATIGGRMGLEAQARGVGQRFQPFSRLERPFAQEDWGLPVGADLEHQNREEIAAFVRPRIGGELRGMLGRLETPGGFSSARWATDWARAGRLSTRLHWERAEGTQEGVAFGDGGRERISGEVALQLPWLEPALRADRDERRSPSDTGLVGQRYREWVGEVRAPRALAWKSLATFAVRRDGAFTPGGFEDRSEARTARVTLETPSKKAIGGVLAYQQRRLRPLGPAETATGPSRVDLASARLRAADLARGLNGLLNFEITSEGEARRTRVLNFVGAGRGGYDSLGNFVGAGDYDLVLSTAPDLRRLARAATSARLTWQFGDGEVWRGSRIEFNYECDTRRRGELRAGDTFLSPGAAKADVALSRGAVLQRLEGELAPGSRVSAWRLRLERRVGADRSFENFAQTSDEKTASVRWRARPGPAWSSEVEARWKRQEASQALGRTNGFHRVLLESGGLGQLIYSPDARLRVVGALDASWSRPEAVSGQPIPEPTRIVRVGPDVGLSVGARGRAEVGARRAFVTGPAPLALFPTAGLDGVPPWEGTARFDYRLRDSVTLGLSSQFREREHRPTEYTGRAELRAFF